MRRIPLFLVLALLAILAQVSSADWTIVFLEDLSRALLLSES